MSHAEFNYSGSKTVTTEEGSLYMSVYSLSKFIRLAMHLVMSKVPLTQVIPPLHSWPGSHHGSLMLPCIFQEAISNSYLSTGAYIRM